MLLAYAHILTCRCISGVRYEVPEYVHVVVTELYPAFPVYCISEVQYNVAMCTLSCMLRIASQADVHVPVAVYMCTTVHCTLCMVPAFDFPRGFPMYSIVWRKVHVAP